MKEINTDKLSLNEIKQVFCELKTGDNISLTGTVYTARDAAHKKLVELQNNSPLPFPLQGAIIYYAGPTPAKNGMVIGSCGPTTSSRMDFYAPGLYDQGVVATIGKGERAATVVEACKKNKAVYLCAIGGAGALAAKCITENSVVAFEELGCESIKRLRFEKFPLTVAIDSQGNDLFERRIKEHE